MDGRAGDGHIDPEELLRSALEKIVFFECRVEQLEGELAAARAAGERARAEAAAARREATDAARTLAGEKGLRAEAEARAVDVAERVRLLEAERERLLSGLQERARVDGAPGADGDAPEEGGAALAGFIAELRAEIERLRAWKAEVEAGGAATPPAPAPTPLPMRAPEPVVRLAERLRDEGRVGVTAADAGRLRDALPTGSDRALFERSLEQLRSTDPARRIRAARALEALGAKAAAPVLAAALGREEDADVKAALLGVLARLEEPFAADLARRALSDARPAVRVAALEALAALAGGSADEELAAALDDASALVRRRAAILLGFSRDARADEWLSRALSDADAGVARAAAAALSGRPSAAAQGALARALDHVDATVRRAASAALARWSSDAIDADAPAHERRRAGRRIAERLAAMGGAELREAVLGAAPRATVTATRPSPLIPSPSTSGLRPYARDERSRGTPTSNATATPTATPTARATATPTARATATPTARATATPTARATATPTATPPAPLIRSPSTSGPTCSAHPERRPRDARPESRDVAALARAAVAVVDPPAEPSGDLEASAVAELRAALRGRTPEEIADALRAPLPRIHAVLHALAARGAVVQRGPRWFTS